MKALRLTFQYLLPAAISCVFSTPALSHGDHPPPPKAADCKASPCTKDEITTGVASKIIPLLIEKQKIDATWKDLKVESAEQKQFKQQMEWVVTFKNEKVTEKAKQTLYVFVTLDGTLAGVNFTGQ